MVLETGTTDTTTVSLAKIHSQLLVPTSLDGPLVASQTCNTTQTTTHAHVHGLMAFVSSSTTTPVMLPILITITALLVVLIALPAWMEVETVHHVSTLTLLMFPHQEFVNVIQTKPLPK